MPEEQLMLFDGLATAVSRKPTHRRKDPLDALPPSLDLLAAAALLGVGRTCAYQLVRRGQWPTPVIRIGRCIRIPTAPLVELLRTGSSGFPQTAAQPADGA